MPSKDRGFLVQAYIELVGGQTVGAIDAFRADTQEIAENYAFNVFLIGSGMIVYGNLGIVADAMCAIRVVAKEEIDLADPKNAKWLESVDLFERFLEEQDAPKKEIDRSFTPDAGVGD